MNRKDELMHYGTPRHSGRYPWGSGENPYQHDLGFMAQYRRLKADGVPETVIAKSMDMNTAQLRRERTAAYNRIRAYEAAEAQRLKDKGLSNTAIGRRMGKAESSIRSLLDENLAAKANRTKVNADILRDAVKEYKYVDVSHGAEHILGITQNRLSNAVKMLKDEGYQVLKVKTEQLGTGKETTTNVLCGPDGTWAEAKNNPGMIHMIKDTYSDDGGQTMRKIRPVRSISSDRVEIRYAEDGGKEKDGVIELRPGVPELDLQKAHYAQVRIAVDGDHYLKGMAVYATDTSKWPKGVDIVFNTNKTKDVPKMNVLKEMERGQDGKIDKENPFGANIQPDKKLIRAQGHYIDENGKEQLSALNIVSEEGTWSTWNRTLASQFLGKQPPELARRQLNQAYANSKAEFDEIMAYTNPTVRKKLLNEFAEKCESDAVHLSAAALPRQTTRVLLPVPELKDNEVYCPGYEDGEHLALVRYPHAGTFEIPICVVNNKNRSAKASIGNSVDAIGVNSSVAERLSGADFDGDTVLALPCDSVKIRSTPQLEGLKDFGDYRERYRAYEGMHIMNDREHGLEMGKVSNLITDMTIQGAPVEDTIRAVRHSMVVVDAKKHKLNYKLSEEIENIPELKARYQGGANKGASTLLSRATSDVHIPQRKEKAYRFMTDEEKKLWAEGYMVYENTGKTFSKSKRDKEGNKTGEYTKETKLETVYRMSQESDANNLLSGPNHEGTKIEHIYADYANQMKELARQARKTARATDDIPYDPHAAQVYSAEVRSLNGKLQKAESNAPLERYAQRIAGERYKLKLYNHPEMDAEHRKRLKGQELDRARDLVGAQKQYVDITDREWEAINAGAISKTRLRAILTNAKPEKVRELALPRNNVGISDAKLSRARTLIRNGHTQADVARMLDISVSTLQRAMNEGKV